jgi:hypothetical protein
MYREDYDRAGYLVLPKGNATVPFMMLETLLLAACSRGHHHHAMSDTARGYFLLCSGSSGNGIHVLRMEIRVRAFESCRTSAADGLEPLSTAVVRSKRDVMHSGQMIQYSDLPADFETSDTSAMMFHMKKPRASR